MESLPSFSILIPARDEAVGLPALLTSLTNQEVRPQEVLIIDDESADETAQVIRNYQSQMPFLVRLLKSRGSGKKTALLTGLSVAQGEVVLTIDADTRLMPGALLRILAPFHKPEVQMSAAYVRFWDANAYNRAGWGRRFLLAFQALEMAGILALTAGSWARGEPLTVNGAFLAYRLAAFLTVGGWGEAPHPGGDDELFMQRLYQAYGVKALAFSGAIAETRPALSWAELWHQRCRWLTKKRYYTFPWTRIGLLTLALVPFLFWAVLWIKPLWAVAHLLVTGSLQAFLIARGMQSLGLPRFLWRWYPLAQFFYPIYGIVLGLCLLRRRFVWKGRLYKV